MPAPTPIYPLLPVAMTGLGDFDNRGDVGKVDRPGSAAYDDLSK